MEEKLKQILDNYDEQIFRYENQVQEFTNRIEFCKIHNFYEEERITRVKLDSIEMVVFRWRKMQEEIKDVLNAWLS